MKKTPSSSDSDIHATPTPPFKSGREAIRALRKIETPVTDVARTEFIDRIKQGPESKFVAFGVWAIERRESLDVRWGLFRGVVKLIVIGDNPLPESSIFNDPVKRRSWLAKEFGTGYSSEAAKTFLTSGSYLRPLYILLNEPDNVEWLPPALTEFRLELLGAEEVANNAKPKPKRPRIPLNQRFVGHLTDELTQGRRGLKALKRDLKLVELQTERETDLNATLEENRRQFRKLTKNLEEASKLADDSQSDLAAQKEEIEALQGTIESLRLQVARSNEQASIQRAVVENKTTEELNAQRAKIQSAMSESLANVKLYADRTEPAREKILRLCDEMLTFLDNPSQ